MTEQKYTRLLEMLSLLQWHWIRDHYGEERAACANYGWVQGDTRRGVFLTTKIYGHGKLYSEIEDNGGVIQARHDFE